MFGRLRTLWALMQGQRLRYLAALAALAVGSTLMFGVPLAGRALVDHILDDKPLADGSPIVQTAAELLGGRETLRQNLWIGSMVIFGITAASGTFSYLRGRWSAVATESIARRLRDSLYEHLQRLPCCYFDTRETGDLVQRCTSDVETVRVFLAQQVIDIGRGVVMFAVAVPLLLYMDLRMAAVMLGSLPIVLVFSVFFFRKIQTAFLLRDQAEGRMTSVLQENIAGIRVVRAFARQQHEIDRFGRANREYRDRWYDMYVPMSYYWPMSNVVTQGQRGLVLTVGAILVTLGVTEGIRLGDLFAYLALVGMMLWPIRQLGRILMDLGSALVAIRRVGVILQAEPEADPPAAELPADMTIRGRLVIRDLKFGHAGSEAPDEDAPPILHGLSLEIEPGQTLAILGPSGSGKSTLIHLLLRFYDYQSGSIQLDGVELNRLPRRFLRSQIGAVLQQPFLYSRSLRENIKRGRTAAGDEEMIEAASAACVHDAIEHFEHGYDTLLGERGVTLSGGQRQRVAIARALLKNPPILILDDALSAVDTETEWGILEALRTRHGHRTTIVIAHRLTTLRQADKIVVLQDGRIAQCGSHNELREQTGLYKRLWDVQTSLEDELRDEDRQP